MPSPVAESSPSAPGSVVSRSTDPRSVAASVAAGKTHPDAPLAGGLRPSIAEAPDGGVGPVPVWSAPSGLILARALATPTQAPTQAPTDAVEVSAGGGSAAVAAAAIAQGSAALASDTGSQPIAATHPQRASTVAAPLVGAHPLSRTTWPPSARSGSHASSPAASEASPAPARRGAGGGPAPEARSSSVQRSATHDVAARRTTLAERQGGTPRWVDVAGVGGVATAAATRTMAGGRSGATQAPTTQEATRGQVQRSGPAAPMPTVPWASTMALATTRPVPAGRGVSAPAPGSSWPSHGDGPATSTASVTVQRDDGSADNVGGVGSAAGAASTGVGSAAGAASAGGVGSAARRRRARAASAARPVRRARASAGGAAAMPERDLETIAHKLYPRLLRRLSSDLLVARERAGMLSDRR